MNFRVINLVPDFTVVVSVVVAYFLDRAFPVIELLPSPYNFLGWLLVAVGVVMAFYTISVIRLHNPTSNVTERPPAIIRSGLFGVSRNPFYLSYVIVAIGAAVALGSLTAFVGPVICMLVLGLLVIPFEERNLQKMFAQEYEQYRRSVRRWI